MKKTRSTYRPLSARRSERKSRNRLISTIIIGIFLLYALLNWVLPFFIGGLSLFNRFKPTTSITKTMDSAAIAPPVLNIPYEATGTANIRIKGYASPNFSVQIYVDNDLKTTISVSSDGSFTTDDVPLNLGNNSIYGKTVDDKGNKSLSSKPIQIYFNSEKPKLDIKEPADNQTVNGGDKKITVSGSTNDNESITVTINSTRVIVKGDGSFSKIIDLNDGENNIVVTTTNAAGNSTQISRKVTYQPESTPTP